MDHIIDMGFQKVLLGYRDVDRAYHGKHSLFGIYKRDYRVYSGKDDGSEVDFIAESRMKNYNASN